MNEPQPMHTAVEMATFLREEIASRNTALASTKARRGRVSEGYADRYEALTDDGDKIRYRAAWANHLKEFDAEATRIEAELFAFRRALQYLTGELWS